MRSLQREFSMSYWSHIGKSEGAKGVVVLNAPDSFAAELKALKTVVVHRRIGN